MLVRFSATWSAFGISGAVLFRHLVKILLFFGIYFMTHLICASSSTGQGTKTPPYDLYVSSRFRILGDLGTIFQHPEVSRHLGNNVDTTLHLMLCLLPPIRLATLRNHSRVMNVDTLCKLSCCLRGPITTTRTLIYLHIDRC
jgi:hypothetical protein